MADSVISFALQKFTDPITREANFIRGVPQQVEWAKRELKALQSSLKFAESKCRRQDDDRIKDWVDNIRRVAYEIANVIEIVVHMTERRSMRRGVMASVSRFTHIPSASEMITLHKVGSEIENIKSKLNQISKQKAELGIPNLGEGGVEESAIDEKVQEQRALHPQCDSETDFVGLEDETRKLIDCLLDQEKKRRCVISIVGMGGLGKTTLALRVYNNPQVKGHFDAFAWKNVSQKYVIAELLEDVMKQVMGIEVAEKMEEKKVREKLCNYLKQRKYLIVLDDVWETEDWNGIDKVFPNVNNGSRLILTTRNLHVARTAEPLSNPLELRLLTDEESWELFCKKALPTIELEDLGRQLAKRCGGLPLALLVLGGVLLKENRSHVAWSTVAESLDWEYTTDGQRCLNILALSYDTLPNNHIKSCFLYLAAFPEDFVISTSKLIKLWVAEGFILQRPKQGLEETARGYIDELVRRSLVQVTEQSLVYERVKGIRIHDMVHNMCVSKARRDGFLTACVAETDIVTFSSAMPVPRVALHRNNVELGATLPNLHTLLGFDLAKEISLVRGLELLRVLDLEGAKWLRLLPKEINMLIHLRYLGLRNTGLEGIQPSSIGSLLNLETLDARGTSIRVLPYTIWQIKSLRHLLGPRHWPTKLPKFSNFKNLRTLKGLNLLLLELKSDWMRLSTATNLRTLGLDGICAAHWEPLLNFLRKLDHLASLILEFSDKDIILAELLSVFLNHHHLRVLKLKGRLSETDTLPNSNYFPPNLTKLVLYGSSLQEDPMPVLEKLPHLTSLILKPYSYEGKIMSCSADGFRLLRQLVLDGLDALEEWMVEAGAMPKLIHLTIQDCLKLKMVPKGLRHLATLQKLMLISMPKEFNSRVQEGVGEDWEQVKHIPSIKLW